MFKTGVILSNMITFLKNYTLTPFIDDKIVGLYSFQGRMNRSADKSSVLYITKKEKKKKYKNKNIYDL